LIGIEQSSSAAIMEKYKAIRISVHLGYNQKFFIQWN